MCDPLATAGSAGSVPVPAREGVADGVFADGESSVGASLLQPGARGQIDGREDNARDSGSVACRRRTPASSSSAVDAVGLDREIHGSGCRFQSL